MNKLFLLVTSLICMSLFTSCNDEYTYEENIPDYLGKNIYDYLKNNGNYNTYVRLIEDLDYTAVLSGTGSKTLFVADDASFERFYQGNSWGVKSYEDFSLSQKRLIFNSSMLNNAMLVEGLSTREGSVKGQVMRRATSLSIYDTIPFIEGDKLPANSYWNRFREKGIRLLKDNTLMPILFFTDPFMNTQKVTNEDFSILLNGIQKESGSAYIFDIKVKEKDIVCQNGYIHVLENVLLPPSNMADVIQNIGETKTFNYLLERFSAPYFYTLLPETNDSIFVKGHFAERSGLPRGTMQDPNGQGVSAYLLYDPGWNTYRGSDVVGSYQTDMATIFAPSDEAFNRYFNEGSGRALMDRYGSLEAIPDVVLDKLVRNHMKASFLSTLPSQFHTITDDAQELIGITKGNVDRVYLSSNGAVYVVNTVFPPALYSSVMFPATINENMRVFDQAIKILNFEPYLLSMVNYYSFFLPVDNFTYINPNSLFEDNPEPQAYKFRYNYSRNYIYASIHEYNPETYEIGDSIGVINATANSLGRLQSHLEDMLNYHIVIGNIEDGSEYYRTKGNGAIRVARNGNDIRVAGGGEIERGTDIPVVEVYDQTKETNGRGNGKTYVINNPLQTPTKSVYKILSEEPEFSAFFELLLGNDDLWLDDPDRLAKYSVFYRDESQVGLDYNVRFLSTFHYTLYVPDNNAVEEAIRNGLPTWEDVEAETDLEEREAKAETLIRFLRYHFQDNAVFLDRPSISASYETATLNNDTETFYKLNLQGGNYSLNISTAAEGNASVKKDKGLYNIMARDFTFSMAYPSNTSSIVTSSYIVIHQIDKCLYFDKNQFN